MKLLITGVCGFVGSALVEAFRAAGVDWELFGVDNLIRAGSETNRQRLSRMGVRFFHGDLRCASDLEALPAVDWVVDAAANASVLAGVGVQTTSRQLMEHNLVGTLNFLECCKQWRAGLILLSSSRVYSIPALTSIPMEVAGGAYQPQADAAGSVPGLGPAGIDESFSTAPPVSLYGASKLASELVALEYGAAFGLQVWINRCGVMAGAGQFGRPEQGIFAYWIHSYRARAPLRYIGFDGMGHQVRDCLHPRDLAALIRRQVNGTDMGVTRRTVNVSGGMPSAMSLSQLSAWCADRFGRHDVGSDPSPRPYDIPWLVLDPGRAKAAWNWTAATPVTSILEEIATHAENQPEWLSLSANAR